MIVKTTNDRGGEIVEVLFKVAESGGSVTQWTPACYHNTGNSVDGVSGGQPAAGNLKSAAGIALETCPINGFRRALAYGKVNSILISHEGTSVTTTAGDALTFVAGQGLGMSSVGGLTISHLNLPYAVAQGTGTYSAAGYQSNCIVRMLS